MAAQQTYLVAVTHSPASLEAVSVACALARQRKAKVTAVHVIEVLRSLPLNAEMESEARRGEQLLRKAEEVATHSGYHVTGQLLQAREAGQAIVDEANDQGIEAIIMGIGYKRLIGAFQVGRTVDFVLKNASCQVWVVRQALLQTTHGHATHSAGHGAGHD
ncbi:MAG: universal stress protein [Chloroflexi bacterium]|nr:universal stress protein [Chloroflexota bacterium]